MIPAETLPCSVPPHPSLLARTKTELKLAKENNDSEGIRKASRILNGETGIAGLNDGSILPRSHYSQPTSIMSMAGSGLERGPLRGAIRYVNNVNQLLELMRIKGSCRTCRLP